MTPQPCQNQPNPVTADTQKSESITANRKAKEKDSLPRDLGGEDSGRRGRSPSAEIDDEFDLFWTEYPKKADKGKARGAYRVARKKATADELVSGARRYANERAGQDPKFTKHPTTWLTAEAWNNETSPASVSQAPLPQQSGHSHHIDVAAQIARQIQQRGGIDG